MAEVENVHNVDSTSMSIAVPGGRIVTTFYPDVIQQPDDHTAAGDAIGLYSLTDKGREAIGVDDEPRYSTRREAEIRGLE